jgi:16S rRNA processing protein RimM
MNDHSTPPRKHAPGGRPQHQSQQTKPSPATGEEWVTIGRIVALFGVQGELKVRPETDIPDRFRQLREIHLGPEHTPYQIAAARPYKEGLLVLRLIGIESANAAKALIGQTITIPLAQIAPLPPDHYYIHDLIGLRVESSDGQALGVVADVLATGGNDVYVVRAAETGREVLVPAVKTMVKRVDISAGLLVIDPIPGLFDDRFEEAR